MQKIPSLLSCFERGKKSTPIPAGIPVLDGFGICSTTKEKNVMYNTFVLLIICKIKWEATWTQQFKGKRGSITKP